jgi:hypothetical protein
VDYKSYADERLLISKDALNHWEFKIKLLEIEDGVIDPVSFKFGDRVLVKKILLITKDVRANKVEERELDLASIEVEVKARRGFCSSNRWVRATEVKNGYIVGIKHFELLASAIALDYVVI